MHGGLEAGSRWARDQGTDHADCCCPGRVPVGMVRAWQSSGKKEGPQASGFTLGILATRIPPLLVPKGSELGRLSPQKAEGQGIELRQAHTDTADQEHCPLSASAVLSAYS